jgi:hypothetical protein
MYVHQSNVNPSHNLAAEGRNQMKMQRSRVFNGFLSTALLSVLSASALADNWFILDGTEPPGAEKLRVYGLLQPTYQSDLSSRAHGLTGSEAVNEGKYPLYSTIAPSYKSTSSFYLFRVRLGVRGAINPEINYETVAEMGVNALTTQPSGSYSVQLAEGSVTLNKITGARLRFGLFKTPGPEEGLRTAIDYVNFTNVTSQFINYQPVTATSTTPSSTGGFPATTSSGVRAFRDTGLEAFDAFQTGRWEHTYAVMIGNGSTLNAMDENNGKAFYGRIQTSYLFDPTSNARSKGRNEATLFLWGQTGTQLFNDTDYRAQRNGAGLVVVKHPYNFTAEYMRGSGMIVLTPLFPGGTTNVFPGSDNKSDGWYVDGGVFVDKAVKLGVRYDVLNQLTNMSALTREYKTLTFGAMYYFDKNARIALNYEMRSLRFPGSTPADGATYVNQGAVKNAIGNRICVQATIVF